MIHTNIRSRKFTLIELIVVVVAGVLMMMLITCSGCMFTDQEQARKTLCISKLKEIGLAERMYAGDNQSYVAVSNDFDGDYVSNRIDHVNDIKGETPGGKLIKGKYLSESDGNSADDIIERFFACPGDKKYKPGNTMSYYNIIFDQDHPGALRRLVTGYDDPGCATWTEKHKNLSHSSSNHDASVMVLFLDGGVAERCPTQRYTAGKQSDSAWDFLDAN